ncbi:MAG: ECF-type sigma factor, partial [Cyanobacteria bacterium P01_F01_bin.42]
HFRMEDVTHLIRRMSGGDRDATDELYELVYQQLRRMAARRMSYERRDHTLDPTGLVNEVFIKLAGQKAMPWQDRRHFFGIAAEAMRRILIDSARAKSRLKRGGGMERQEFSDSVQLANPVADEWLDLDAALTKLEAFSPELASLVKMHIFSGLTLAECSQAMEISLSTAERKWRFAKGWLKSQLSNPSDTHVPENDDHSAPS